MSDFIFFYKEREPYGCFSNFYPAPFQYAGRSYSSSEQFMMAQKALAFWDMDAWQKILDARTPAEAKALGKTVQGYDDALWDRIRFQVVRRGVRAKFQQTAELRDVLMSTGDRILVEAAPRDKIWGVGMAADDPDIIDSSQWRGTNLLGQVLMQVRSDLRVWAQSGSMAYVDALDQDFPVDDDGASVWGMQLSSLMRNPVCREIMAPFILCATQLLSGSGYDMLREDITLGGLLLSMRTNMGGGIPCCGFYEMFQDMYDAVRHGVI